MILRNKIVDSNIRLKYISLYIIYTYIQIHRPYIYASEILITVILWEYNPTYPILLSPACLLHVRSLNVATPNDTTD